MTDTNHRVPELATALLAAMQAASRSTAPCSPTDASSGDSVQPRRALAAFLLTHRSALDELAEWLVDERMAVHVHATMASLGLGGLWPRSAFERLQDQWTKQQQHTAQLLTALAEVTHAFQAAGIEVLVLKGLPLASRWYGGVGARFTWDLDLLVREAELPRAVDLLGGLGFVPPAGTTPFLGVARRVAHALECRRADGLSLDLHWAFRRLPGVTFDAARVFADSQSVVLNGLRCRTPSDEDTLTQLLLGIAADADRSLCRLRSVWDARLLLSATAPAEWGSVCERRRGDGATGLLRAALAIVGHRLDLTDSDSSRRTRLAEFDSVHGLVNRADALELLSRQAHDWRGHRDFAAWLGVPGWRYWGWWAATLPARAFFARRR